MKKWIRVKDKLPEKDAKVLGYDTEYDNYYICTYDGKDTDDEGNPWLESIDGGDDYRITYWMPLPHPPNVEYEP